MRHERFQYYCLRNSDEEGDTDLMSENTLIKHEGDKAWDCFSVQLVKSI